MRTLGYYAKNKKCEIKTDMVITCRIKKRINVEKFHKDHGGVYENQCRLYHEIDKKKIAICHTGHTGHTVFQLFGIKTKEEKTTILGKLLPKLNECLKNEQE